MKNKKYLVKSKLFGVLVLVTVSLISQTFEIAQAQEVETIVTDGGVSPTSIQDHFRNSFAAFMDEKATLIQKQNLIFPFLNESEITKVSREMTAESLKNGPEIFFQTARKSILPPEKFLKFSQKTPFAPLDRSVLEKEIQAALSADGEPITIVFIPGIFGEFIDAHPYQDVLEGSAPLREEFLKKIKDLPEGNPNKVDGQFKLYDLKEDIVPLDQLVLVGALKGDQGQILANTLSLHTEFLSLDSLGSLRSNSFMFNRRLSKFFNVIGRVPKKILLVGYSRSVLVTLDMLSLAAGPNFNCKDGNSDSKGLEYGCKVVGQTDSWLKNVTAVLSVAGVLYGSDIADSAFELSIPKPADLAKKVELLKQTANNLQLLVQTGSKLSQYSTFLKNSKEWLNFLYEMAKVQFGNQELSLMSLDWKKLYTEQSKLLDANFKMDFSAVLNIAAKIAFHGFNLNFNSKDYNYNKDVMRFKKLADEAIVAIKDLTSKSRTNWWQNNVIPASVKYYSIVDTMLVPPLEDQVDSPFSYNRESPDFLNLQSGFLGFIKLNQKSYNDSQVSIEKAIFYPDLISLMNPSQDRIQAFNLGLFHTHHWGLALQRVAILKDRSQEPFPRLALLKAVLSSMAKR